MRLRGVFFTIAISLATNLSMSTPANASINGCLTALTQARDAVLRETTYAYATLMFPLSPMKSLGLGGAYNHLTLSNVPPSGSLYATLRGMVAQKKEEASIHNLALKELQSQGVPLDGRFVYVTSGSLSLFVNNERVEVFPSDTALVIDLGTLFPVGRLKKTADGVFGTYEALAY